MKYRMRKGIAVTVALLLAAMSRSCAFAETPQAETPQLPDLPEVTEGAMREEISLLLQALNDALDAEKKETDNYMKKMESLRENVEDAKEALMHALQNAGIEWDGSGYSMDETPELPETEERPLKPEKAEDWFPGWDSDGGSGWDFDQDDGATDWYFDWDDEDLDWLFDWDDEDSGWFFDWDDEDSGYGHGDGFDWFGEGEDPRDLFQGEEPEPESGQKPGPEHFGGRTQESQDEPMPSDDAPQAEEGSPENSADSGLQDFFDKIVQAVKGFFTNLFQPEETTGKI